MELCRALLAADIPLRKLSNIDESTLQKMLCFKGVQRRT